MTLIRDGVMEVFAFPYAGGSEHCYRDLARHLDGVAFKTQALPGRGRLMSQSCITETEEMVEFLFRNIKTDLHRPYVFFGHSMGAFLAYLVCQKIRQENLPLPKALILSGRKAPSVQADEEPKHTMPSARFREMLQELGGTPDAVNQDEEIMDLFEPVIRADFQLIETHAYQPQTVLDIPIHLFIGREDEISVEQAQAWQRETRQPLKLTFVDGGHFFFKDDEAFWAGRIADLLTGLAQEFA